MAIRTLTFNGTNSALYGLYVASDTVYNAPVRQYEHVEIMGRNGDVLLPLNRYENIDVTYRMATRKDVVTNIDNLKAWLLVPAGYQKIEDDYYPDTYRMGYVSEPIDFEKWPNDATTEITFNCKPQRFFKQDENGVTAGTYSNRVTLTNPSGFTAKPLIKMYANTTLTFQGGASYGWSPTFDLTLGNITEVQSWFDYAFIDCETLECYRADTNLSQYLTFGSYASGNEKFPFLDGYNSWGLYDNTSSNHSVIYPRWWTL